MVEIGVHSSFQYRNTSREHRKKSWKEAPRERGHSIEFKSGKDSRSTFQLSQGLQPHTALLEKLVTTNALQTQSRDRTFFGRQPNEQK